MKHKKRLYELTVELPKKGKTMKVRFRSIDSVHASASIMKMYGKKSGARVISAVPVKED